MKKTDSENLHSPSAQVSQQKQGALDETRELFEQMVGEAKRHSEIEKEHARTHSPVARFLLMLTLVACLLAVATGVYGVYNFPDAPIRQSGNGYVGKGGKPHTQEDFEAFLLWKTVMFSMFPAVFVLGFAFVVIDANQRRKRTPVV